MDITKNNEYEGRVVFFLYGDPEVGLEAYEAVKKGYFEGEEIEEVDDSGTPLYPRLCGLSNACLWQKQH